MMKSSKLQVPSSKKDPHPKLQSHAKAWTTYLEFGAWDFFGAWNLELGASSWRLRTFSILLLLSVALPACAPLTADHQPLASKPNMQFTEAHSLNAPMRITSQLEPGRVVTGGAQPSVCPTCR